MRARLACARVIVVSLLVLASMWPAAAQDRLSTYAGRPLAEVLEALQASGLKIVFSSELVRPDMRVAREPRSAKPRDILDEVLRPHRLRVVQGLAETLLVVRAPRRSAPVQPSAVKPPARSGSIRGWIVDARAGTVLSGVLVVLQGAEAPAVSDSDGVFEFNDLPAGSYTLLVSLVRYGLARPTVDVPPEGTAEIVVPLVPGTGSYTEKIDVSADVETPSQQLIPSFHRIGSAEFQDLRGVLLDDPFRAVQVLPGVGTGDDFRSEFFIRGSDSRHMGLSIDDVPVPWLLHAVQAREDTGSIAMLNGDVLEQMSLAAASYPQRFGNRTGAWLETTIREGSREARVLRGAVGATNASVVAEGPIGREQRGAWLTSVRQSYLDFVLRRIGESGTAFGFTDLQSKMVYDVTARHQVSATLVAGRSRLDERNEDPSPNNIAEGFSRAVLFTAGLRSALGSSSVVTQRIALVGRRFENVGAFGQQLGTGASRELSYRADLMWTPAERWRVELGGDARHQRQSQRLLGYGFQFGGPVRVRNEAGFSGRAWSRSGYGQLARETDRWSALTGVRVDHSTLLNETTMSPWLQAGWRLGSRVRLRVGSGMYRQFPEFMHVVGPVGNASLRSERARHFDIGIAHELTPATTWEVTLYDRQERDFLRLEHSEHRLVDGRLVMPTPAARFANSLRGSARGIEVLVRREGSSGLTGWLSYAFGRTRYTDQLTRETYWGDFDQRHTMNGYGHYRLSNRTSVNARLRVGSNTPIPGYLEQRDGRLFVGRERNALRFPVYARLDLRVARTFNYTRRRLTLFVEVINILNRTNLGRADRTIRSRTGEVVDAVEDLFPLLPSAGILVEF